MGIAKWSDFDSEIAVFKTFEELKLVEDKAAAVAKFLKDTNAALSAQNECGRYRVEIEDAKGKWLNDNYPKSVKAKDRKHQLPIKETDEISGYQKEPDELPEIMPVTKKESTNARLITAEPNLRVQAIQKIEAEGKVVTPSLVASEIRKVKRIETIEAIKSKIETENLVITDTILYDVIAIDPPWNQGGEYDPDHFRVTSPYPEMTFDEISKIKLPLKDDAVVFLWTTRKFLKTAFEIVDVWGLDYKEIIVWDKVKMGIGTLIRRQCEFCLLCTKGSPLINGAAERDIITEARRQHSRKPEEFYLKVNRMCTGRKLDYFSRSKRNGWDSLGIETDKFKENVE